MPPPQWRWRSQIRLGHDQTQNHNQQGQTGQEGVTQSFTRSASFSAERP